LIHRNLEKLADALDGIYAHSQPWKLNSSVSTERQYNWFEVQIAVNMNCRMYCRVLHRQQWWWFL
jgi:hypothetical protein